LCIGAVQFSERTSYPLTVTAAPGEELELRVAHDLWRFEGAFAGRVLAHLRQLLAGMADDLGQDGEARVWELPLLSAPERHQMLAAWDDTPTVSPGTLPRQRVCS